MDKTIKLRTLQFILILSILIALLPGCKRDDSDNKIKKYSATTTGYGGDVTVEISITQNGKIGTIRVDTPKESPDKGQVAGDILAKEIIKKQSLSVDAVSGATITSTAVLTAAETALKEAGVDTEAIK